MTCMFLNQGVLEVTREEACVFDEELAPEHTEEQEDVEDDEATVAAASWRYLRGKR